MYNLNIIDGHSYVFSNSLKSFIKILLGRKCKLTIYLFFMFINSKLFGFCKQ